MQPENFVINWTTWFEMIVDGENSRLCWNPYGIRLLDKNCGKPQTSSQFLIDEQGMINVKRD
jgi:hypothetical protein